MVRRSLWDIHQEWVDELLKRGEKVLEPKGYAHGHIWGYVKTQIPHKDAGTICKNENGTFNILCDRLQYIVTDLKLEDIGLCDIKCWYEWMDNEYIDKGWEYIDEHIDPNLKNVKIKDLVDELLSRERVTSQSVSHGRRFPDLSHDGWNLRTGPAEIIIIETFERKDGYK